MHFDGDHSSTNEHELSEERKQRQLTRILKEKNERETIQFQHTIEREQLKEMEQIKLLNYQIWLKEQQQIIKQYTEQQKEQKNEHHSTNNSPKQISSSPESPNVVSLLDISTSDPTSQSFTSSSPNICDPNNILSTTSQSSSFSFPSSIPTSDVSPSAPIGTQNSRLLKEMTKLHEVGVTHMLLLVRETELKVKQMKIKIKITFQCIFYKFVNYFFFLYPCLGTCCNSFVFITLCELFKYSSSSCTITTRYFTNTINY
jgi:hypothetical protein